MTVGVAIKCSDGIVLACDSLATFSRGVPVKRFSNKVYVIEHEHLENPVAIVGAGLSTFIDKFIDRGKREAITNAHELTGNKLDIVDFCTYVCEPLVAALFKEYCIDRTKFFGAPVSDYSLFAIVAGATREQELRAYFVHPDGLTENIADYGTVGSGAAYAELFLRDLLSDEETVVDDAASLCVYAIKGVEIMDPHVGGKTNVSILTMQEGKLAFKSSLDVEISDKARGGDGRHSQENGPKYAFAN